MLRIARVLHHTTSEGPGTRTAIWVQGCSIRCHGCINPHLFSTRGGYDISPANLIDEAESTGCEGITILGGEPFDQASACAELAETAQTAGLGVIVFTGYRHEELTARGPAELRLLDNTDCLVDGPYEADNPENRRALVGSTNQRFVHLTDRYSSYNPHRETNQVDIRIKPDGTVELAGFLTTDKLTTMSRSIGHRRR